jgi:lipopolysaccharide biosynthesis regulator YciM
MMNLKAFFVLLAALVLVFGTSYLIIGNHEVLKQNFTVYKGLVIPMYIMLALAFGCGLLISFAWILFSGFRTSIVNWRRNRLQRAGEAVELEYGRGVEEILSGRDDMAMKHFQKALAQDPRHLKSLLRAGETERKAGRLDEAVELHQKAHHLAEGEVAPLYALADDYEALEDWNRLENCLKKIVDLKPKTSFASYRRLRDLYIRTDRWEEAEAVQSRIRTWPGQDGGTRDVENELLGIRYQIGQQKRAALQLKEAISEFRRLLRKRPDFIPAYLAMGETQLESEHHRLGLETWEKGFMATNSPIFLRRIAEFLLERDDPQQAIEIHRRVAAWADKDIIARFMLGKLYYRLEMVDDANDIFDSLREDMAHSPTLHYLLARIRQRRGDFEGAMNSYRQVLHELQFVELSYECTQCHTACKEWADRCTSCNSWGTIEVQMQENIASETLGLSSRPVYLPKRDERLLLGGKRLD